MEANRIPSEASCEGLIPGVRTNSFDVVNDQLYSLNKTLPEKQYTLNSHTVSNYQTNVVNSLDCVSPSSVVEDSNRITLKADSIGQRQPCLAARCSDATKVKISSIQNPVDLSNGNTTQQAAGFEDYQLSSKKDGSVSSHIVQGGIKEFTSCPSLSSFDMPKDIDQNIKSDTEICHSEEGDTKTCHNDESDTMPSSAKIVITESDSGALQMFLIEDPDLDLDEENPGHASPQIKTKKIAKKSLKRELSNTKEEMENMAKQDITVSHKDEIFVEPLMENELTNNNLESDVSYGEANNRRLRSAASYTCNIFSVDDRVTDFKNETLSLKGDLKRSKKIKSKSAMKDNVPKVKLFRCDVCDVTCNTAYNLRQHKMTHKIVGPIQCSHCNYSCKRRSDMRKHEETHNPGKPYKCLECDYSGKRLKYLKKHMRTHNNDKNTFSCHLCKYRSKNKLAFENHLRGHSKLTTSICLDCGESFQKISLLKKHMLAHTEGNLHTCSVCELVFKEKKLLKKHKAEYGHDKKVNKHTTGGTESWESDAGNTRIINSDMIGNDKEILSPDADDMADLSVEGYNGDEKGILKIPGPHRGRKARGGPIKCNLCRYSCVTQTLLKRHMRRHSEYKPYVCSQCGVSFRRRAHLKAHRNTHNDHPYQCPHCFYGTHLKYRLKIHMLTHQINKPIKCSECVYSCRRECELRYHMRSKHGIELNPGLEAETPADDGLEVFKCELCDYTCCSAQRIKYHVARHENKTPHSCPHCDYKCSSRSSLSDHLLRHAGLKPCLCPICGMSFRNTSRLNRHKLVHSDIKPHACNFCDFSSRSRYNLKQHMLRHTDQDKTRRRSRQPAKQKNNNSKNIEVIKQSSNPEEQSLVGSIVSNLYTDNVQPQSDETLINQDSGSNPEFIQPIQPADIPQYNSKSHMDITNELYKNQDLNDDHNGFNTVYQCPSLSLYPNQIEKSLCPTSITAAPTYNDPYQNPLMLHPHPMSYNSNINTSQTNQNFCYMDRGNSGYGFPNSYYYNEAVFPENMNTAMNFYMFPGTSSYTLNPSQTTPLNQQNTVHCNPSDSQVSLPVLSAFPEPLLPVVDTQTQSVSETEDSMVENLTLSEDISMDDPANLVNETKSKHPKSQAKKTGATLNGRKLAPRGNREEKQVCSECGYICLTNTMLQRHKATHIDTKPHRCDTCGKSFRRLDHMKAHRRSHNRDNPFHCKHCSYTCNRKYRLKRHEKTHINMRPFSCIMCEETFDTEEEMEEHAKTHLDGSMFVCTKCDFKCKEKPELKVHSESHKIFLCEMCSYVCRSGREFSSHKRMHAERKEELSCALCNYTCDSQKRLKYHMDRHNNKTPLECSHCDYKCSSRSSLSDHLLQHEGLKPFLCSVCGMKFRNGSRLNRHKMTHTDVKPHNCEYCSFSSRSRYNLKQHTMRHFK